eukprot:Gb_10364 [translate_table: standard]
MKEEVTKIEEELPQVKTIPNVSWEEKAIDEDNVAMEDKHCESPTVDIALMPLFYNLPGTTALSMVQSLHARCIPIALLLPSSIVPLMRSCQIWLRMLALLAKSKGIMVIRSFIGYREPHQPQPRLRQSDEYMGINLVTICSAGLRPSRASSRPLTSSSMASSASSERDSEPKKIRKRRLRKWIQHCEKISIPNQ